MKDFEGGHLAVQNGKTVVRAEEFLQLSENISRGGISL